MHKFLSTISAAVFLVSTSLQAADTYITADAMVDVITGKLVRNPLVIIKDDTIIGVGTQGKLKIPSGADHIDLSGQTIMPGFMDMHVHLSSDADAGFFNSLSYSAARQAVVAVKNAKVSLMAGFTTVRDLGASGYSVIAVRDGINAEEIIGPRIFAVGHALGVTGGHCDTNIYAPEMHYTADGVADGPWAAKAKVRENIKYGANAIKFCATGGVFSKGTKVGAQQYSLTEMKAIVEAAHLREVTVAAHAHGTSGIKDAIRAGVDSVEHVSFLDGEAIEMAVEAGTYLSIDIYNTEYTLAFGALNGVPEENINKERLVSKAQRDSFTAAVKAGAKVVFGSDAGVYPHGDNGKQFSRMVQFGMTPMQAIQAATNVSADLIRMGDTVGSISAGKIADIVAVAGNPLDDISVLEDVTFVMARGRVAKK